MFIKLTSEGLLDTNLVADDICLASSTGGGKTLPERRCKLFVAPMICRTLLL